MGLLFLTGLYISSVSSGMGGIYGAPRILQCIANDGTVPVIRVLSKGVRRWLSVVTNCSNCCSIWTNVILCVSVACFVLLPMSVLPLLHCWQVSHRPELRSRGQEHTSRCCQSIKNTFVKGRMSQANQSRIVAETRQSVHVHYRQCQTGQCSKYAWKCWEAH